MPHIGALMERSLQERSLGDAFADLLARSAVAALGKRQFSGIQGDITDAKTAFSSWDNCMQATFCKWPVIAVIIVGGLIIFSIVWCIIRCCCCGGKRHKHLDDPFDPHKGHDQAYRTIPPMNPNFPPIGPAAAAVSPAAAAPQYAVFETGGDKKDADSLPAMPTWEDQGSKKIMVEEEPVEMEPLKKPDQGYNTSMMNAANMSHATIPSPGSAVSRSPYGPPPGSGGPNGYMAPTRAATDPYGTSTPGYDDYSNNGYGHPSQDHLSQEYAVAGGMAAGAVGRRTPHQDYNNGYDHGGMDQGYPQSQTPRPYDDAYGRSVTPGSYANGYRPPPTNGYGTPRGSPGPQAGYGYGDPSRMASPGAQQGYGHPNRMPSPGSQGGYGNGARMASPGPQAGCYGNGARMASPGPQAGGYGGNASRMRSPGPQAGLDNYPQRSQTDPPQRSQAQTPNSYGRQQQPPAPYRQYSSDSTRPLVRPGGMDRQYSELETPESPIQNNGGFDFNSGYSRPEGRPTPPPPQQQSANGGTAYPGYRAYKPS
ncbi:Uu.00g048700.m01.CDS01 [Anthostomella pinea]|uniref:Uu.00g048700.m01.CDS01 n=1 Tax=Anthostomella pinea TaxID=933095 RepID=A0AAI8VCH6_9PEZI|nr:Uu.00g048700.m01.CDS01 [Anthostomella pinea]